MRLKKPQRYKYIRSVAKALARIPEGKKKTSSLLPFSFMDDAFANGTFRCMGGGVPVPGDATRCGVQSYAGFSCRPGQEICNPLIFGAKCADKNNPDCAICSRNATTAWCYRNTRVGTSSQLNFVYDAIGSTEWNRLKTEMDQFCSLAAAGSDQVQEAQYLALDACNIVQEQSRINVQRNLIAEEYSRPANATREEDPVDTGDGSPEGPAAAALAEGDAVDLDAAPGAGILPVSEDEANATLTDVDPDADEGETETPEPDAAAAEGEILESSDIGGLVELTERRTGFSQTGVNNMAMGPMCNINEGDMAILRERRRMPDGQIRVLLEFTEGYFAENNICPGGVVNGINGRPQVWINVTENDEPFQDPAVDDIPADLLIKSGGSLAADTVVEVRDIDERSGMFLGEGSFEECRLPPGTQGRLIRSQEHEEYTDFQVAEVQFPRAVLDRYCPGVRDDGVVRFVSNRSDDVYPFDRNYGDTDPAVAALISGEEGTPTTRGVVLTGDGDGTADEDPAPDQIDGDPLDTPVIADDTTVVPDAEDDVVVTPDPAGTADENAALAAEVTDVIMGDTDPDPEPETPTTRGLEYGSFVQINLRQGDLRDDVAYTLYSSRPGNSYCGPDTSQYNQHRVTCNFSITSSDTPRAEGIIVGRQPADFYRGTNWEDYGRVPVIQFSEETWSRFCNLDDESELQAIKDFYADGGCGENQMGGPFRVRMPDAGVDEFSRSPFGPRAEGPLSADLQGLADELGIEVPEDRRYVPTAAPGDLAVTPGAIEGPTPIAATTDTEGDDLVGVIPLDGDTATDVTDPAVSRMLSAVEEAETELATSELASGTGAHTHDEDCGCDDGPHVEGPGLCDVGGPNAHEINETCERIRSGQTEVPVEAFEWAMQFYRNNLGQLRTSQCWHRDEDGRNSERAEMRADDRWAGVEEALPRGINNRCQMIINDTRPRQPGNPAGAHRRSMYFIDLCSGDVVKSWMNMGTGTPYANAANQRSTLAGAFLTAVQTQRFVPCSDTTDANCLRRRADVNRLLAPLSQPNQTRLGLLGMQGSNNRAIADGKPMHVTSYPSSHGCPSIDANLNEQHQIIARLAGGGPSLVVNYAEDQYMDDPATCSTDWTNYE